MVRFCTLSNEFRLVRAQCHDNVGVVRGVAVVWLSIESRRGQSVGCDVADVVVRGLVVRGWQRILEPSSRVVPVPFVVWWWWCGCHRQSLCGVCMTVFFIRPFGEPFL